VEFVGAAGDLEGEIAKAELGVAEEGGVGGGDQLPGDVQQEVVAALVEDVGQFAGESFLIRGQGLGHGVLLGDWRGGFLVETTSWLNVYGFPTTFRDAHTSKRVSVL
jgi:hypothetical protein